MLPELVRRLVRATVATENLKKIDFPSDAEVQRPGYDGTTVVTQGTPFVPEGIGLWELGCVVSNAKGKAEGDYEKRVGEHEEKVKAGIADDISQATFIAVTPVDWQGAGTWANDKTSEKRFREVRAYDSNQLEHWLWEAPAVGLWLAQAILGPRKGVWDINSHWADLQASLIHKIPSDVLLVNREGIKAAFAKWLQLPGGELVVRSPSISELVDVFCAWVHSLPEKEAELIRSRAIIVEDRETWRDLATSINPLILIAAPRLDGDPNLYAAAQRHHVLRFAPFSAPRGSVVEMERMRRFDVQEALRKAKIADADAVKLADASGGNFTILRRRLSRTPSDKNPEWGSEQLLAPLLLAGSWQDGNPHDQEFVTAISGKTQYGDIQTVMTKWRQANDPPVRLVDGVWEFLSPMDAWEFLHPSLTSTQLDAFQKAAEEVLAEDDPAFDLSPDDRPMASFKGKTRKFSEHLRQGIGEILALGSAREEESFVGTNLHFADRAASIVRKVLPSGCDWKRWASLGDVLRQLVEAAPESVIEAVERDLRTPQPALVELLRSETPPGELFGRAYQSGILWALEKAAWSSVFLPRVALALAKLSELDPGGKWTNRPESSLQSLFFSWRPQTMASVRERLDVLNTVIKTAPTVGWKLLLNLLPQVSESISDNPKPSYRDWAAGWTGTMTSSEYQGFVSELMTLLLASAAVAPERWMNILEDVNGLAAGFPNEVSKIREQIKIIADRGLPDDLRTPLWEKLRQLVRDHTFFHDAHWALPPDEVRKFAELRDQIEPTDEVIKVKHLFDSEGMREGDKQLTYEQRRDNWRAKRQAAIRQLWTIGGFKVLERLAKETRDPWNVGLAIADELKSEVQPELIPKLLTSADDSLRKTALGYSRKRILEEGAAWAQGTPTPEWSESQVMAFALEMPFERSTWDWIAARGNQTDSSYWEETAAFAGFRLPKDDALYAVKRLQEAGRAWAAVDLLAMLLFNKVEVDSAILCDALDAILTRQIDRKGRDMDVHNVTQIFEILQKRNDVDVPRLARLEFAFMSILGRHSLLPHTLQDELARDPDFFVECLTLLYRPHSAPKPDEELPDPDGTQAEKAKQIWRLLYDWQKIPGSDREGNVTGSKLKEWVAKARQKAKEADRLEICDVHIGQVFAQSGEDIDNAIPVIPIREVIDECDSEQMQSGYSTGLHNLRGTFTKGIYEGGDQERKIAAVFNRHADLCANWPRTSSVLRSVASDYLRQAEREDERAKARD